MHHLCQVEKTYKVEKYKDARDSLLHKALDGESGCMEAVKGFTQDPQVLTTFISEAKKLLRGHVTRGCYSNCLGLLAGRLMLW